jgi:hypothetical protein
MAFSTKRGRPKRTPAPQDLRDLGTPELRSKRAAGLTLEPLDRCHARGILSDAQHWCGLHLRWLHTLRYGAPMLSTHYLQEHERSARAEDDPTWRREREAEYHAALGALRAIGREHEVLGLAVYHELPSFLCPTLTRRAWENPALATQLAHRCDALIEGFDLLVQLWRKAT